MDEHHALATQESAERLWQEWRGHLDTEAAFHVEKSPPNLVRTRFLQALFPDSRFVAILRHPAAVACATHRRVGGELDALLEHALRGYELFADDLAHLRWAYVLRYEDLVARPVPIMEALFRALGLAPAALAEAVRAEVNEAYFRAWREDGGAWWRYVLTRRGRHLERRARRFGYSMRRLRAVLRTDLAGEHAGDG